MNEIKFYSVNDEYGEFSNFAFYEIYIDKQKWKSVEHYFHAQKFEDKAYQKKIKNAANPMLAANLGRNRKQRLRKDWESVKISVMRKALYAKFTQYPELTKLLLETGEAKLTEHTENDAFWGDGGNGKGKNWLGILLMQIREELKK